MFAHKLKKIPLENPPPSCFRVTLQWKEVISPTTARQQYIRSCAGSKNFFKCTLCHNMCRPKPSSKRLGGYDFPRLVENNEQLGVHPCPHRLCTPCVISQPPSFLTGSAAPALGNISKRFSLYRKFWQMLKELGLWSCETYMMRKSMRTRRDDPREIIPECIVKVKLQLYKCTYLKIILNNNTYTMLHLQLGCSITSV